MKFELALVKKAGFEVLLTYGGRGEFKMWSFSPNVTIFMIV